MKIHHENPLRTEVNILLQVLQVWVQQPSKFSVREVVRGALIGAGAANTSTRTNQM